MKKRDIILILAILFAILFFATSGEPAHFARITKDGKLYSVVSLYENIEIVIGDTNVAEVLDGRIFMKSATCPDKLCIHQGEISDSSKKIVCLPNRVVIEAIADSNIDTVVK